MNLNYQAELHAKYEKLDLKKLLKAQDEINDKIEKESWKLEPGASQDLLALFNSKGVYSLDFKFAKSFNNIRKKLTNSENINTNDLRIIQQLVVSCKFSSPVEAEMIDKSVDATTDFNIKLFEMETELRVISTYIVRKENEEKSGLKYSEEDTKNMQKLEGAGGEDGPSDENLKEVEEKTSTEKTESK